MAIKLFNNRVVEFPGRRRLTPVSGQTNVYDVSREEGTVYTEGTFFDDAVNELVTGLKMQDDYEGTRIEYDWANGLVTQQRHYDSNDNIVKQIDYTWVDGVVNQEVYTLKEFSDTNQLENTHTVTATYTWVDGVVTQTQVVIA